MRAVTPSLKLGVNERAFTHQLGNSEKTFPLPLKVKDSVQVLYCHSFLESAVAICTCLQQ